MSWEDVKNFLWEFLSNQGKGIAWAIVVFVVGLLCISLLTQWVRKTSLRSRRIDKSATPFLTSIVSLVAYVVLFLLMIATLGFSTESIITAFASVALAIALGLQNTLASLANGILLIFTKPFKAGDYVDIGGTGGTPDNLTIVIPNNTVFGSTIINYSKMPLRRIDIVVPVGVEADVAKVKSLICGLVESDHRIVKDPAPFFRLTEYGKGCLNFTLRAWTKTEIYWDVRFDLLENIVLVLGNNGIKLPYHQLDVHWNAPEKEV